MMKNNILDIINSCTIHNEGILVKVVAKLVNLSDKSITHYIKELKEEGKIKTSEKTGRLVSTSEIFKDPIVNSEIFGYYFKTKLLNNNKSNKNTIILNPNTEYWYTDNNDETKYFTFSNELFEPNFTENDILEEMLFEFSNRIGSFITYLIIYAMNPDNYDEQKNNKSLSGKTKDEIAKEIINKGILSITPFLASFFRDMYDKRTGKYPYVTREEDFETKKEYLSRSPQYIINEKESILALISAFTRLYPLMSYEFEKIMPEQHRYLFRDYLIKQPSGIEGYKKYMKEFYEYLKNQEKL